MKRDPAECGFVWVQSSPIAGYWSKRAGGVEVCLEPMAFTGWELAVYDDESKELLLDEKLRLEVVLPWPTPRPRLA